MPDRIRDGLGQSELQVGEQLVGELDDVGQPAEGEPRESDVLRTSGDTQAHGPHALQLLACGLDQCCLIHRCLATFP